jgi:hypothetical protein
VVPAAIGAWLFARPRRSLRNLVPVVLCSLAPSALWQAFQLASLGFDGYLQHLSEQRAALNVSASAPFLSGAAAATGYLLASPMAVFGLLGLLYALRRDAAGRMLLPMFTALWLVWFVVFSVGYQRYAIPLIAVGCLFAAVLARDLVQAAGLPLKIPAMLVVAAPLSLGIISQVQVLAEPSDTGALKMGALIRQEVDPRVSIESLDWELDVLSDRLFHHPPPFVPAIPYSVPPSTEYLVDGPASKSTELYVEELRRNAYEVVASAGQYDLYRRAGTVKLKQLP